MQLGLLIGVDAFKKPKYLRFLLPILPQRQKYKPEILQSLLPLILGFGLVFVFSSEDT